VKASSIQSAQEAVIRANQAAEELETTTSAQLWLKELTQFETAWDQFQMKRANRTTTVQKSGKKGKST
jgi:hypothetical protein